MLSHNAALSHSPLTRSSNGHLTRIITPTQLQSYENWSILVQMQEQSLKRGGGGGGGGRGSLQRKAKMVRGNQKDRQRLPCPPPRHTKPQHGRPTPVSRKRRFSGRMARPSHSVSEGDMAQADEMGEGEGGDDGFVDSFGSEGMKRRSKKRGGGIHMLLPAMGNASPPSSPSNTPVSRRRPSSRKSRLKPRSRKSTKQPKPASADISTQETTTPGPNSSDTTDGTSSHDEPHPLPAGEEEDHTTPEHHHSATPNPLPPSSESSRLGSGSEVGGILEYSSPFEDPIEPDIIRKAPSFGSNSNSISLSGSLIAGCISVANDVGSCISNSEENLQRDSCETSDTDLTSLSAHHPTAHVLLRKPRFPRASKRFDSDFSTAPLSSETSDMDTSGNEKVLTDGGSASDVTSLSRDSRSDASDLFAYPLKANLPRLPGGQKVSDSHVFPRNELRTESPTGRKIPAKYLSTAAQKRPLLKTQSTPTVDNPRPPPLLATPVDVKSSVSLKAPAIRPKPPLAVKPTKLDVRPKPSMQSAATSATTTNQLPPKLPPRRVVSQEMSGNDLDAVNFSSQHSKSIAEGMNRRDHKPLCATGGAGYSSVIRKVCSEGDFNLGERKGAQSPIFMGKLSRVNEEGEEREGNLERIPTKFPLPRRPLVPLKPKIPPPSAVKRNSSPTCQQSTGTPSTKQVVSRKTSSEDPSSTSDANSGHSSSSPAVKRKPILPQKPTLPPKKPSFSSQSLLTNGLLPSTLKESIGKRTEFSEKKMSEKTENGKDVPPPKPPTKRRTSTHDEALTNQNGGIAGTFLLPSSPATTKSTDPATARSQEEWTECGTLLMPRDLHSPSSHAGNSISPPPIPARKPHHRKSSHSEVSIPVSPTSPLPDDGKKSPSGKSTPPILKRPKCAPRRPPPNPPALETRLAETTAASSNHTAGLTTDPEANQRHSGFFSSNLSEKQVGNISQAYDVDHEMRNHLVSQNHRPEMQMRLASASDGEAELQEHDSGHGHARSRKTHYEMTFIPSSPPPIYKPLSESSGIASPLSSDDIPPPLPSQPIPKKKDRRSFLRRGPIQAYLKHANSSPTLTKSGESQRSDSQSVSSEGSGHGQTPLRDALYDEINDLSPEKLSRKSLSSKVLARLQQVKEQRKCSTPLEDPPVRRETQRSVSFMFRRSSSDRFKKYKVMNVDPSFSSTITRQALHRTPSLDRLDDRMERSVKMSAQSMDGEESSSDEEPSVSPSSQALPLPQVPRYTASPKAQKKKLGKSVSAYIVSGEDEPLYQYINTAEFLRTPQETVKVSGRHENQLEIARQLSSKRLWCEQPEIIKSGLLLKLSEDEKKLQEAIFEVVTTEATYLRSLDVLIDHFMDDPGMNPNLPEGRRVLDKRQHHVIFSNVKEVREVSARFLEDLQARKKEGVGIGNIVLDHAESKFECYFHYCKNQIYQTRELQESLEKNPSFRDYLRRLESHKKCQNLNMHSFLLLPMQRITRLPLLILAILNKTPQDHSDHKTVENSLRSMQKLVTRCNDGARKMERTEQLHAIHKQLDFGKLKPFPLVSISRQLERRGSLMRLKVEEKLFGRHQIKRKQLYVFVFTDLVMVTKRKKDPKGDYTYKVVDYASRALVEKEDLEPHPNVSFPKHVFGEQDTVENATWAVSTAGEKHSFLLILLDNVFRRSEKYIFVAQNDTDKTRWMESLATPESLREDEKIYQHWDCPQVQAIYDYKAVQPDELNLERGDVVKVYRKMKDGWYEGERLRDLEWGWFPSNFTMEVENEHTRARNIKETHRLLSLHHSPEEYIAKITTIR